MTDKIVKHITDTVFLYIPLVKIPIECADNPTLYRLHVTTITLVAADLAILTSVEISKEEKELIRREMFSKIKEHPLYDKICEEMPSYQYIINTYAKENDVFIKLGEWASQKVCNMGDPSIIMDMADRFVLTLKLLKMIITNNNNNNREDEISSTIYQNRYSDKGIEKDDICIIDIKKNDEEISTNKNCLYGFIFGLISIFLGGLIVPPILAVIYSLIGINKFNQITDKNKWMGYVRLVLGIVYFFLGLHSWEII